MNILDFEKWTGAVKEGFDAKIKNDKDVTDEIEIEAPNEDNTITYVVNGDVVKSKKIISTDNGEQEEESVVDDTKLENDIINAVDTINDIKDRVQADELRRLTGGDKTETTKKIKEIYKENTKNNSDRKPEILCKDNMKTFFSKSGLGEWIYLNISNIEGKYLIDRSDVYHNFKPTKGVGKGEYLLPLLFDDVYKQKIHGEDTKGDNFIVHHDGENTTTYNLELKSPNSSLGFKKYIRDYIEEQLTKNENDKNDIYTTAIALAFLNYAKKQQKNWGNLYMCIFGEDFNNVLFINLSGANNNINENPSLEKIKSLINLVTKNSKKIKKDIPYSFSFTYNGDATEPKINCWLHSEAIQEESLILSRDNFINEYYTK
jgi:hypothetical protein